MHSIVRTKFFLIIATLNFYVFSQTLDEDFLQSLPQDIRAQLLSEMNQKELQKRQTSLPYL